MHDVREKEEGKHTYKGRGMGNSQVLECTCYLYKGGFITWQKVGKVADEDTAPVAGDKLQATATHENLRNSCFNRWKNCNSKSFEC